MLVSVPRTLWLIVTLPFRLVMGVMALFGRLTALVLGFALMVLGVAVWAGPLPVVGIPVFVVGLLLTFRAIE